MPNPKTGPFDKRHRLKSKSDFQAVFDNGLFYYNKVLKVGFLPNQLPNSRLGLIVSKQHGNAPQRNRIKRLLREVYRQQRTHLLFSTDILIIPKFSVEVWDIDICREALLSLLKKYNDSIRIH